MAKDGKKKAARPIAEIEAEIEATRRELEDARGADCEVYTRIVGYYRSVKNWNAGKREEYNARKLYAEDRARAAEMCACGEAGERKTA